MFLQGRTQKLERCLSESKAKEQRSREVVASLKHSYRCRGACHSEYFGGLFVARLGCHWTPRLHSHHHPQATSAVHTLSILHVLKTQQYLQLNGPILLVLVLVLVFDGRPNEGAVFAYGLLLVDCLHDTP